MPIVSGVIQVGDQTPVLLEQQASNLFVGLVKNTGNRVVYLGDEDVTTATGFPFEPGEVIEADMEAKTPVYAISAAGGTELRWLVVS